MAVATPVLERRTVKDNYYTEDNFGSQMTADEIHNASIKENYAKLINPDCKLSDFGYGTEAPEKEAPVMQARPAQNTMAAVNTGSPVYLVQGARADADLFRADSDINKAFLAQYGVAVPEQAANQTYAPAYAQPVQTIAVEEEESIDLRPTETTTQYRTIDASGARISDSVINAYREGEISRPAEQADTHSRLSFTKRDKIIMGVVLGLIVAVFVLIIVNSAIISSINAEIASLDGQLITAQQGLTESLEELEEATSYENVYRYAMENGIID
ncbi:MAG: hypothetical protein LUI60_01870 [Clostridia bacterium]|nr:hypothetical protein [Clostridia bacterium]